MPQATLLEYFAKDATNSRVSRDDEPTQQHHLCQTSLIQREKAVKKMTNGSNEEELGHSDVTIEVKTSRYQQNFFQHMPQAKIGTFNSIHLASIKRLTSTTLPVKYPDKFFNESIHDPEAAALTRVVLYESEPVGWIRCRLEPVQPENLTTSVQSESPMQQLYIQALCLLAPYRGNGFATTLLETVLRSELLRSVNLVSVYAHVWEENEVALNWYAERGFKKIILVDKYYRRLQPAGAWVLRMDVA